MVSDQIDKICIGSTSEKYLRKRLHAHRKNTNKVLRTVHHSN